MGNINKPMGVPELNVEPPVGGKIRLSEDMQQTLALLTAYGDNKRIVLKTSESGVLAVASRRVADVVHYTATSGNYTRAGGDIPCTEVMVGTHPDNVGLIWVRPDQQANPANAWPLAVGDVVSFTLDNLKQLNMFTVLEADTAIVAYTR